MNWEMVGALAELLGATAVVVSLLYLGRQLREGTAQAKASAYSSLMGRTTEWTTRLGLDPRSAEIYGKGLGQGFSGLSETERLQFILLVLGLMRLLEEAFLHRHNDSFPEWADQAIDSSMVDLMATLGFQDFWRIRRHQFSPSFQSYVDGIPSDVVREVHGQVANDPPGGEGAAAS